MNKSDEKKVDKFPLLLDIVDVALHSNKIFPGSISEFFMFYLLNDTISNNKLQVYENVSILLNFILTLKVSFTKSFGTLSVSQLSFSKDRTFLGKYTCEAYRWNKSRGTKLTPSPNKLKNSERAFTKPCTTSNVFLPLFNCHKWKNSNLLIVR